MHGSHRSPALALLAFPDEEDRLTAGQNLIMA